MNPSQPKSKSLSATTELLCVASAILVAGHFLEYSGLLGGISSCHAQSGSDLSALDYAHSVPLKQAKASTPERARSQPANGKSVTHVHPWYRYALPLSTAMFLLTFGIWSLQSQANHAISWVQIAKQAPINQAIANECCGTPPTSACQHAIAERALPLSGSTLGLSR